MMQPPVVHGTYVCYVKRKCRCEPCRLANRETTRRARERRAWLAALGDDRVVHGLDSTYSNYGCRCDPCKEAHRVAMRRYKIRARVTKKLAP